MRAIVRVIKKARLKNAQNDAFFRVAAEFPQWSNHKIPSASYSCNVDSVHSHATFNISFVIFVSITWNKVHAGGVAIARSLCGFLFIFAIIFKYCYNLCVCVRAFFMGVSAKAEHIKIIITHSHHNHVERYEFITTKLARSNYPVASSRHRLTL